VSNSYKRLSADAEVSATFAFGFVVGSVVEDFGGVLRSIGGFAFDVVAYHMGDAGDLESSRIPPRPAEEEVLCAFALVACKIGVG
jgi:hypothetical protein